MTAQSRLTPNIYWALFFSSALTIGLVEFGLTLSHSFTSEADLFELAITLDLALGIPALYYLFIIRKRLAPFITLLPIIVLSLLLTSLILPAAQHTYLGWAKHAIPFLELAVIAFIFSKLRVIARNFRAAKASEIYATEALAVSIKQTLGNVPVLGFILTEFALLYFAFGGWFKHFTPREANHLAFSYHRKSGYAAILAVMFMVILTETVALHLLLQQWSTLAAWIFTALSLYSMLWLLGDYHALRLHPFVLDENSLHLRLGLRWRVDIPWENIVAVQPFSTREKRARDYLRLTVFGDPRLVLSCKRPVIVRGLFGLKREVRHIGLMVDDEKLFREELERRIVEGTIPFDRPRFGRGI